MIDIKGPGAVGGLIAAMTERSGQVVSITARRDTAAAIAREGISIRSVGLGDWTSRITRIGDAPGPAASVLAVKGHALPDLLAALTAAQPAELLVILNGVTHVAALRAALPTTRVIGASITVEVARCSRTLIEHRSTFVRLTVAADVANSGTVRTMRAAGVDVATAVTEQEALWRKYRFLAPMALLTALHDMPLEPALDSTCP